MRLDRRTFLLSLASSAAMLALPGGAAAAPEAECFAAARRDDRGNFSAALFTLNGDVRAVELPQRGHDITLKPDGREWVAFARRPGRFGVAIPLDARPPVWFAAKPDRHFFGHGVFSADGRLLYTTENDYQRAAGVIGVRDATAGYRQIGEFPAHGLEPHDIALLSDGRTMVIANGGIQTHPDRGDDELNIPDMQPSLVYVDVATGELLEEQRLAPALHQLSIRHLAIAAGDEVVFGCQYRGPEEDAPALVGFHRRGQTPVIVEAAAGTQIGLRNYVGSVAADSAGAIVAASAPKGGLVTYWDVAGRRYLGSSSLNDGCGLAPTHLQRAFPSDQRRGVAGHGRRGRRHGAPVVRFSMGQPRHSGAVSAVLAARRGLANSYSHLISRDKVGTEPPGPMQTHHPHKTPAPQAHHKAPPPKPPAGTPAESAKWSPRTRLLLIVGSTVIGVAVLALIVVNLLVSADWVRDRVASHIKEQTGRVLEVKGTTSLLFVPGPRVVITDATFVDPEARAGTADFSVGRLVLDLSLMELLSRQVDAERVLLERPVLTVRLGDDDQPKPDKPKNPERGKGAERQAATRRAPARCARRGWHREYRLRREGHREAHRAYRGEFQPADADRALHRPRQVRLEERDGRFQSSG